MNRFPSVKGDDKTKLTGLWNEALGKEFVARLKIHKRNYDSVRFCSLHFKDDDMTGTQRKRLKPNAVPSKSLCVRIKLIPFYLLFLCDPESRINFMFMSFQETANLSKGSFATPKLKRGYASEGPSGSGRSSNHQGSKRPRFSTSQAADTTLNETVGNETIMTEANDVSFDCGENQKLSTVDLPFTETSVIDLTMKSRHASIADSSVIPPLVADPTYADESQEGTFASEAKETTQLDTDPAASQKLAHNLIMSGRINMAALLREEERRTSEQDLDIDPPAGPTFAAQIILWQRFKKIFLAGKVRLQLKPNGNAFTVMVSRPLMNASTASESDDSLIDIDKILHYSLPFPLPPVILDLLNQNAEPTSSNTGSDRYALLVCDGVQWVLIGCFLEDEGVSENPLNQSQPVSEVDMAENVVEEDQEEAAVGNGLQLPDPPSVDNSDKENKREVVVDLRLGDQIKEMNETLMDIKAELANSRSSLASMSPAAMAIQPSTSQPYNTPSTLFHPKVLQLNCSIIVVFIIKFVFVVDQRILSVAETASKD